MDFFFIQMSDPQFGMFARLSSLDEDRIAELHRSHGWNIIPTVKTVGFAQETALYEKAIEAANRLKPDVALMDIELGSEPNGISAGRAIKEENEMEMNEKHRKIGEDLRGFEHERR